jgi:arylsulfatase A-like enzyme
LPTFRRYLNALHYSDKILGQLLQTLESKGLSEATLVVVVGDHGEAFGRHNQFVHASRIYEENVQVPLMLINPGLFKGEENPTVGGHVDIAPTIMQILKLPAPAGWQGQSLLSQNRSGRTYFFSPWSDLLFGYREGNFKFIFNATNNSNEIYDLTVDPQETTNLSNQTSNLVSPGHRHLAAWVQNQDKFIKELLSQ